MKHEKPNVVVGDIVSLTTSRLVKTSTGTIIQPYTQEGEVIDKNRVLVTVLVGKVKKDWEIKHIKLVTTSQDREFSTITLTKDTVLNFGNSYRGTKLKDVPAFYLNNLIQNEYIIPDNLKLYIAENWDDIFMQLQKENEELDINKIAKFGQKYRQEILKEHEIDISDEEDLDDEILNEDDYQ